MSDASIHLQSMENRQELALSMFGGKRILAIETITPQEHNVSIAGTIDHFQTHDHPNARASLRYLFHLIGMAKETVARTPAVLMEIEERLEVLRRGLEQTMATEEKVVFDLVRSLDQDDKRTVTHGSEIARIQAARDAQERLKTQMNDLVEISEELPIEYGECGISVAIHQKLCDLATDLNAHFQAENDTLFQPALDREADIESRG